MVLEQQRGVAPLPALAQRLSWKRRSEGSRADVRSQSLPGCLGDARAE